MNMEYRIGGKTASMAYEKFKKPIEAQILYSSK